MVRDTSSLAYINSSGETATDRKCLAACPEQRAVRSRGGYPKVGALKWLVTAACAGHQRFHFRIKRRAEWHG